MATLILEIQRRSLYEYLRVERFPFTVGRSLDNDLILSDPTVSPHHLRIDRDPDGRLLLTNLSRENGTVHDGSRLGAEPVEANLPAYLEVGRVFLRLLSPEHSVAKTRMLGCRNGGSCFFQSRLWSVLLPLLATFILVLEKWLHTYSPQTPDLYLGEILEMVMFLLFLSAILSALNRLSSHRWEYRSAWILGCILYISLILLDPLTELLNFIFSSLRPEYYLDLVWIVVLAPLLLFFYFTRTIHAPRGQALAMTLILCIVPLVLEVKELITNTLLKPGFSAMPEYSQELSPLGWHVDPAISIDRFVEQAQDFPAGEKVR
jgi:hypothetical protein